MLPTFYITDCYDDNTKARLTGRIQSLIPHTEGVQFVGVKTSLEAAGNLVDILDALEGHDALIFMNVAPRGTGRWPNGTPFCEVKYANSHIFSTFEGYSFSLLQKLSGAALTADLFDIPTAVPHLGITPSTQEHIINSQFRSFDFLPRVAAARLNGDAVPFTNEPLTGACPNAVWWQDNFGNFKTTLLPEDVGFLPGKHITLNISGQTHTFTCYTGLKDIPAGETGIYIGSSGLPEKRLLECTKQKGDGLSGEHTASLPFAVGAEVVVV